MGVRVRVSPRASGVPADLGGPRLPPSKSHAQRAMLLAAFGTGTWRFEDLPPGDDVRRLAAMLEACGARVRWEGSVVQIDGAGPPTGRTVRVDAGENGTAARALLMLVPLLGGRLEIDGSPGLRRRPMLAAAAALRSLGIECPREELPMVVDGVGRAVAAGTEIAVDAATTTQAASGAMLALALAGGGRVRAREPRAVGYLDLTAQVLRQFGSDVACRPTAFGIDYVVGRVQHQSGSFRVPPDPSARVIVLVLAAMHGVSAPAWLAPAPGDLHPDLSVDADIERLLQKSRLFREADDVEFEDAGAHPDAVPALAALAATRAGCTTFGGVGALRTKESDRLQALAAGLGAAGAAVTVEADTLRVRGPLPAARACVPLPTVPDHRIVMALSLLGTVLPHGVELEHAEAVAKSWPDFFDWLARCAAVRFDRE